MQPLRLIRSSSRWAPIFICLLWMIGCHKNGALGDKIVNTIDVRCKEIKKCTINIKELTDFSWDRMAIFVAGSSNQQISETLGTEYPWSMDLVSGIIFVYKGKIVYKEEFPYHPEKPNILNLRLNPDDGTCKVFTPKSAIFIGKKKEIDHKQYYSLTPLL